MLRVSGAALLVVACGGAQQVESARIEASQLAPVEAPLRSYEPDQLAVLPEAPWQGEMLSATELPDEVREVLDTAENRQWCAPLVPSGTSAAPDRAAALDGGWSLEFDVSGAAGLGEDGDVCEDCGRASFGIAGTSMAADMVADADTGELPPATFRDGSTQALSLEEGVASATITVGGQDCVYQVWSFQGEAHLESLLEGLRLVRTETPGPAVASH